jgi:hypothetical protein
MSTAKLPLPRNGKPKQIERTLECELSRSLRRVASERNRELVARHLGWDGRLPCSLAEAGVQFQLTRERARQVYAAELPVLRRWGTVPALDTVLAFVRGQKRELACDVEQLLVRQGLTDGGISLQGILCAAQVFGRNPGFQLHRVGGALFVGPVSHVARTVLNMAMKMVAHHGAVRVSELRPDISKSRGRTADERLVRRILETRPDVRWLDDAGEWFWLTSVPRNRLLARVRKVLAVCPRIHVSQLHRAISRAHMSLRLPEAILRSICTQLSWCRMSGPFVESRVVLRVDDVLRGGEAIVCIFLQDHGGALPLAKLENLCFGRGVGRDNLWRILSFSPLIQRTGKGVYGLVGAKAVK